MKERMRNTVEYADIGYCWALLVGIHTTLPVLPTES